MPVVCTKCGIELETYEDICTHKYHCKYGTQPTSTNTDMLQLLCDIWNAVESSQSLRLSLPIPLAERIHEVVAQQQHV